MVYSALMATHTSAREASKAINDLLHDLLHYSLEDQDALLDVLDEYFTSPEDLEEDSDAMDTTGKIHIKINTVYSIHIAKIRQLDMQNTYIIINAQ